MRVYSKKRDAQKPRRAAVVAQVLDRDGGCQWSKACLHGGALHLTGLPCAGPLDVHEIIPRSAWAKGYLEPSNCIALCRAHHGWVGDHPTDAHAMGLHGYSWERPAA